MTPKIGITVIADSTIDENIDLELTLTFGDGMG